MPTIHTIRLVPSTYQITATGSTVNNINNAYTDTDSTTYASFNHGQATTGNRYIYLRGFNLSAVPSNAIVDSFVVKIKGKTDSNASTAQTGPRLCNGSTGIGAVASTKFTTSITTITCGNGSVTWSDILSYGANFGIQTGFARKTKNTATTLQIYGAEIEVNYYLDIRYNVSITNNTSITTVPSTTQSLYEGEDIDVVLYTNSIVDLNITDNNVDISNDLVYVPAGSDSLNLVPNALLFSTEPVADEDHAKNDVNNTTWAAMDAYPNGYMEWGFDIPALPNSATIDSISCEVRAFRHSTATAFAQLYCGSTPKGNPSDIESQSGGTILNIDCGTWTADEVNDLRLHLERTDSNSGTKRMNIYGANLMITYTIPDDTYIYSITNIQEAHNIVIDSTVHDYEIGSGAWWVKIDNGAKSNDPWKKICRAYYKQNGTWKSVSFMYRKTGDMWYTVYFNPIIQADFINSSLACSFPLDNTTSNFTIDSGRGSAAANGLSLDAKNLNPDNSNFVAGVEIPANTLSLLRKANQDLWFTAYITISGWGTGWKSGSNNGFGSSLYSRNENIHNFIELNNPTYYSRPSNTTIANNTPTWVKFQLSAQGYMIAKVWESGSWVTCKQDTTTSKALWNNTFNYLGLHGNRESGNMLISYFRVWTYDPSNTEIGI